MGANCLGCVSPNEKKPHYSKQPADTLEFHPQKLSYRLHKLKFLGQLDNVQIINYPYDVISINFSLNHIYDCTLPVQRNIKTNITNSQNVCLRNKLKWKFQDRFTLMMDEYELRKSFIKISIFKSQPTPILQLNLNLYLVITGPYHHDLALNFPNKTVSRLLFDLKISQQFQLLISPLDVYIQIQKQYPGQTFNYSFNAYSCSQKIVTSEGSIPQKVSIFANASGNYRQLKAQDECQSPTRIRKGKDLNKMIKNNMRSQLHWVKVQNQSSQRSSFKQSQQIMEAEKAMPTFKLSLKSNQIFKSSLQFALWKIQFNQNLQNNQAIFFADSYFVFPRLFQSDYLNLQDYQSNGDQGINPKRFKKQLQNRVCILQQSLIKDGRAIGKVFLKLKIVNQIYFNQLSLHARTEDGIIYMNAMFKNYAGRSSNLKPGESLAKIQCSFQTIVKMLYSLNILAKQKKRNWIEFNKLQFTLVENFNLLYQILIQTLEQSLIIGKQRYSEQMIERQTILLNIIQKIYIFLEEQDARFVPQLWKILLPIVKRGQFYLQNIGLADMQKRNTSSSLNFQQSNDNQPTTSIVLPKKIANALRYQQIMYKILITSLNFNYQNQRDLIIQAQAFKAYGYFRVPKFREQIIKCIQKNQQEQYSQQIQMLQSQKKVTTNMLKVQQKLLAHLDWQKYFYNYLKNQRKYQELNQYLEQNLKNKKWFETLSQKKQNFFIFIEYFSKKMAQLGKRLKFMRYSFCPGYNKLVKSFLIQMKKIPIIQYGQCMIQTSTVLLANHNLINIIIPIIVQKTNLYDSVSVNQFLNIFSTYLKYLSDNGTKMIPQKFNHTYFFKIIKIILESQYSYAIAKILVILHTYFECFNDQFKDNLSLYLLSKAFFRLFFHWSFNIRIIFYHLFIIKIYWSKLNGVTQKSNLLSTYHNENCQVYNRYKKLIKILNTAERQKNIKKKNMKRQQKQDYYVKMKRKLDNKLKQQNPEYQMKNKQSQSGLDSSSQHQNQKQRNLNLARLQNLSELTNGYNRSQTLCSSEIKEHLRHLKSGEKQQSNCSLSQVDALQNKYSNHQKQNHHENENIGINLKYDKKKMSKNTKGNGTDITVKEQIQKLNQEYIKLLNMNSHKSSTSTTQQKPLVYTLFGNDDYQLEQISLNEQNKILMGMQQFRQTQQFVEKYILQKGVAPHVNLDPQFQIDGNQFKPLQLKNNF